MAIFCLSISFAEAHPPVSSVVQLSVAPQGTVTISIHYDALAFALGQASVAVTDQQILDLWREPTDRLSTLLENSRQRWIDELHFKADESDVIWSFAEAPTLASFHDWKASQNGLPHPDAMNVVLHSKIPTATSRVSIQVPRILDQVLLVIERPGLERSIFPLDPGEESHPIDVSMVPSQALDPSERTAIQRDLTLSPRDRSNSNEEWFDIAWRFMRLGFLHIVPRGADHALFVLGLFLLTPNWRALLIQISAFTSAHTVTLTLASLKWVFVSPKIVEPLIAISILVIAIENLWVQRPRAWRVGIAFGFGLIHGLGFASGLIELGLPTNQLVLGLAAFSIGVEGGHVAILSIAFMALGWSSTKAWFRARIAEPLSIVIGILSLYWLFERIVST